MGEVGIRRKVTVEPQNMNKECETAGEWERI